MRVASKLNFGALSCQTLLHADSAIDHIPYFGAVQIGLDAFNGSRSSKLVLNFLSVAFHSDAPPLARLSIFMHSMAASTMGVGRDCCTSAGTQQRPRA